jgi:hypothetical protein
MCFIYTFVKIVSVLYFWLSIPPLNLLGGMLNSLELKEEENKILEIQTIKAPVRQTNDNSC